MRNRQRNTVLAIALALVGIFATTAQATSSDENAAQSAARDATAKSTAAEQAPASKEQIQALIRELASPHYTTRRAAASELRRIGADAFDALFQATENADPEVAASARYLLRQINVHWVQNEDSAAVRRLLKSYTELPDEARRRLVAEIAKLPNREGLAALCRIVRYDRTPLISRVAALAVIWPDAAAVRRAPVDHETIDRELGESSRTTTIWIRQYQAQLRDPAASLATWQRIIEEESNRLARNSDETIPEIQVGLMWNLADIYRQLNNRPALLQTIDRIVRLETNDPESVAREILKWLVEEKSWDAVDDLLARHQERFTKSKRALYWAALARHEQGKSEQAEQLAEQASRLDTQSTFEGYSAAKELEVRGQYDWAVREYHRAIDNQPLATTSHEAILCRISLASLLHDHEADKQAADVLDPLVKSLRSADGNLKQQYIEVSRFMLRNSEANIPEPDSLIAQFHYYRACQYAAEKDWERQRATLKLAIQLDSTDADVLIAMFRAPDLGKAEEDQKWRADISKRIANLARDFQQEIDASPNESHAYNQWAWLISNTEGDFQKAVQYSQKSIELNTMGESAEASFQDTLGRCYYAVGDFENAVKFERLAVAKVGYLQVMRRQLAQFEKALAEKKAANKSPLP